MFTLNKHIKSTQHTNKDLQLYTNTTHIYIINVCKTNTRRLHSPQTHLDEPLFVDQIFKRRYKDVNALALVCVILI